MVLRLHTVVSILLAAASASAQSPCSNALLNGDAESGTSSPNGYTVVPVPSWLTTGTFTVVAYSAGGGFPDPSSPGPLARGSQFFTGGPSAAVSTASQTVDLSALAASIDSGGVGFALSGWLGGFQTQDDQADFGVQFLSSAGAVLGGAAIGPVTSAHRNGQTGMLLRSTSATIPVGARSASLVLTMTRFAGTYNDGYADNLTFVVGGAAPAAYCTAGTTSNGCTPSIAASGTASASAPSGFTISVSGVEGQKLGLILYGIDNTGWTPVPWGLGSTSFLCVKPPTQRMASQNSGGTAGACNGTLSADWNAFITGFPGALGMPFSGGETVYAQGWFRDPAAPKTTNLSNGLSFPVCP